MSAAVDLPDWVRATQPADTVDVNVLSEPGGSTTPDLQSWLHQENTAGKQVAFLEAPASSGVQVVQVATDGPITYPGSSGSYTASFSLATPPTPGNVLAMLWVGYAGGTEQAPPAGWALAPGGVPSSKSALWYHEVASGDGQEWSFPLFTNDTYQLQVSAALYELSGAETGSGFLTGEGASAVASAMSYSYAFGSSPRYGGDLALSSCYFDNYPSTYGPLSFSSSLGPLAVDLNTYGGHYGMHALIAHGPSFSHESDSTTYTVNLDETASTGPLSQAYSWQIGAAPSATQQLKVLAVHVQGGATDTPEVIRTDTGQVLASALGGYPVDQEFPDGVLIGPGSGLNVLSDAAAEFGVVYQIVDAA